MDLSPPCPDAALLAAFIDGTLTAFERDAVVAHLLECRGCRAVALRVAELQEVTLALPDLPAERVPQSEPRRETRVRRWVREKTRAPALWIAGLAAFAAVLLPVYVLRPAWSPQDAVAELIEAAEAQRPIKARLSGAVDYAPPPVRGPSAGMSTPSLQLVSSASYVRDTYASDYTVPSRRAVGLASLLVGDIDEAVASLEIAALAAPGDARVANDLAAAYYERAVRLDRPDDLPAALDAAERALTVDPGFHEALFNRALIIEALGLRKEASDAWREYLAADPDSVWAAEARRHLAQVAVDERPAWSAVRQRLAASPSAETAGLAVGLYASFAREYIDRNLLATWSDPAGSASERAAALEQLRALAAAFEQRAGDRTYADLLPVLTSHADRVASMAAHREFAQAVQLVATARFTEAAGPLARAHARLAAVSSPLALRARVEQATVAYVKQEYSEAIEIASEVAARAEQAHYVMIGIRAAWIEGMAAFNATQYDRSQAAYERMMHLASSVGDADAWVTSTALLANLYDRLGDARSAWRYRVAAARRLHEVPSQSTRLNYLLSAAGDALAGNHHAAALLFQSALEAQWKNSIVQYVQVRTQRIAALHHLGRTPQAIRELGEAREHVAQVQHEFRSRVDLDLLSTEVEIYRGSDPERSVLAGRKALQLVDDRTDPLRRARLQLWIADALFQLGKLDDARSAAAAGIGVLEDLRRRPSAEFSVRPTDPAWRLYETAAEVAIRQGDVKAAFELSERGRARTRREAESWDHRPASLAALQQQLGADTAAVVLSSSTRAIRVWIVRRSTVDTYEVPLDQQQLAALIASHHDELRRGGARPAESGKLYRALFPARDPWAGVRHVVIVADAPLDRVAYAALWDDQAGEFLVEKAAIAMAPSVRSYLAAMERAPSSRALHGQRAALVDPGSSSKDAPEKGTQRILEALAAVYADPVLRVGRDATPSDLAADVVSSDIVHVTAPVVANRDLPELSYLALAADDSHESRSFLPRELAGKDAVRASVVAIEPVQAEGASAREPGTLGMARALLAAGVPTIVTSLAASAARDVAAPWVEFHRNYATGLGAAESLRLAQIAALRASDRQLGPWATLAVFGATR